MIHDWTPGFAAGFPAVRSVSSSSADLETEVKHYFPAPRKHCEAYSQSSE